MGEKLLRRVDVLQRCGISVSTLYRLMATGEFPRNVKTAERSVAWPESEINGWIQARISERDCKFNQDPQSSDT